MENPWKEFEYNSNGRHVLKADEEAIEALKEKIKEKCGNDKEKYDKYRLRLNLLPEPFVGHKDAPIYLLNLNPGYDEMNDDEMKSEVFRKCIIKNNNQENKDDAYPFYWLDPNLKAELEKLNEKNKKKGGKYKNGCEWWEEKLKGLFDAVKKEEPKKDAAKLISKKIFCIEYFPYHSKKWFGIKTNLKSQEYSIDLIRNAIEKDKIFIIMRNKTALFKLIKSKDKDMYDALVRAEEDKDRVFRCFNSQNPCITEDNLGKKAGFREIVDLIK